MYAYKKQTLLPKFQKILKQMGENIKLAGKRRNLTTIQVAEWAGINHAVKVQLKTVSNYPELLLSYDGRSKLFKRLHFHSKTGPRFCFG